MIKDMDGGNLITILTYSMIKRFYLYHYFDLDFLLNDDYRNNIDLDSI